MNLRWFDQPLKISIYHKRNCNMKVELTLDSIACAQCTFMLNRTVNQLSTKSAHQISNATKTYGFERKNYNDLKSEWFWMYTKQHVSLFGSFQTIDNNKNDNHRHIHEHEPIIDGVMRPNKKCVDLNLIMTLGILVVFAFWFFL